ncbi:MULTISPECIES: hypothetical protein [unclassified Eikenella]|uniref:hypothetical protein n=1 Tax=unclassified Eikenella TaxID=2639367 RepID=UPI0008A2115A|nr:MULTISPECIES: hypothetical protein [unclassified Eikenella]OFK89967.1 hypothetical protein HMPREF2796_02165 [Eikenella sp. HMSC071B05]OFO46190.1 hypothetical protein HMPREF3043_03745 [Eikenella sp. HMSC073A11]
MSEPIVLMPRWRFALRLASFHLLGSAVLAGLAAWLVIKFLYPYPYSEMLGGLHLLLLIVGVDVVCGPLLTLILASPKKSRRDTCLDFALITVIQLGALSYGIHAVYLARPVYYAFDHDRFAVVTAAQLSDEDLAKAPENMRSLPLYGVEQISLATIPKEEMQDSVLLSLGGIEPVARPNLWLPLDATKEAADVRAAMKPVGHLIQYRPAQQAIIKQKVTEINLPEADMYYLPFTSDKNKEWIALLNKQGEIVDYLPIDGFTDSGKNNE